MSFHRFIWEPKSLPLNLRSCHGPLGLHAGSDVHLRHGNPQVMHTLFHTLVASFPLAQEMCPGWMVQEASPALTHHCLKSSAHCRLSLPPQDCRTRGQFRALSQRFRSKRSPGFSYPEENPAKHKPALPRCSITPCTSSL